MGLSEQPVSPLVCKKLGKVIFTKSQAKSAAKRDARRSGKNVVAFKCRTCTGWHTGTLYR